MNYIEFGNKALKIRKKCGFTREAVKDVTGISIETLRRLEMGVPEPRINTLEKLSSLYRYDLIELLSKCRSHLSFFSEELIKKSTDKINQIDLVGLVDVIDSALQDLMESSDPEDTNSQYYTVFLNALKSLKIDKITDSKVNVIVIEDILLILSRNQKSLLNEPYLFPFEVMAAIYLISLYRQSGQFATAINTCEEMIRKLEDYPYLNDRGVDQLGALYQSMAYIFHTMDEHEKVIEFVDAAFANSKLAFTNTLYINLVLRKAIAFHNLGNRDSYDLFTVAIQNSYGERKKFIAKVVKEQYGVDHHLAQDL
jgi:transcriptional regulator with XRE-family HTH domain